MLENRIRERLKRQKITGLYRNPDQIKKRDGKYLETDHGRLLNFASNDYLGLGSSKTLRKKVAEN